MDEKKPARLDVHVPPIAGSDRVGKPPREMNLPEAERCPACEGTGAGLSKSLAPPLCRECGGTGKRKQRAG
jgi:DnaJ-class molecular chaperone